MQLIREVIGSLRQALRLAGEIPRKSAAVIWPWQQHARSTYLRQIYRGASMEV
jgi:hypothetical protein